MLSSARWPSRISAHTVASPACYLSRTTALMGPQRPWFRTGVICRNSQAKLTDGLLCLAWQALTSTRNSKTVPARAANRSGQGNMSWGLLPTFPATRNRHPSPMFHLEPGQKSPGRSEPRLAGRLQRKEPPTSKAPPGSGGEGFFRFVTAVLQQQVHEGGHRPLAGSRLVLFEAGTLEVPQHRGVDFPSAAKRRADLLAEGAGGVHYFLVIFVSVRLDRLALQEGESFPLRWPPVPWPASLHVGRPSVPVPECNPSQGQPRCCLSCSRRRRCRWR